MRILHVKFDKIPVSVSKTSLKVSFSFPNDKKARAIAVCDAVEFSIPFNVSYFRDFKTVGNITLRCTSDILNQQKRFFKLNIKDCVVTIHVQKNITTFEVESKYNMKATSTSIINYDSNSKCSVTITSTSKVKTSKQVKRHQRIKEQIKANPLSAIPTDKPKIYARGYSPHGLVMSKKAGCAPIKYSQAGLFTPK